MLNRSECKKMWVWDDDDVATATHSVRIVTEIFEDGCCRTVADYSEGDFESGSMYETEIWDHYGEIEESKMRSMTRNEVLGFIAYHPYIVIRFEKVDYRYLS